MSFVPFSVYREEQSLLGRNSRALLPNPSRSERKQPCPGKSPVSEVVERVTLSHEEMAAGFLPVLQSSYG